MTPRTPAERNQRTRRAILKSAHRLFVKQGFAATSMREIAHDSRLALGGIYNHFHSKEELFRKIMEDRHPFLQILPVLEKAEGDTLEGFVRSAAQTLVDELRRHPDFLNLMLTEIVEFKARHVPRLFRKFLPMTAPLMRRIGALDGATRDVPGFVLVRAFLGMFVSYYITEMLVGRVWPRDARGEAMQQFADIYLYGILEEPRT
jgi:AcrR family transcriptional regulator